MSDSTTLADAAAPSSAAYAARTSEAAVRNDGSVRIRCTAAVKAGLRHRSRRHRDRVATALAHAHVPGLLGLQTHPDERDPGGAGGLHGPLPAVQDSAVDETSEQVRRQQVDDVHVVGHGVARLEIVPDRGDDIHRQSAQRLRRSQGELSAR